MYHRSLSILATGMLMGVAVATAVLIYLLRPTPSVQIIQDVPSAPTVQAGTGTGIVTSTDALESPMVVIVMSSYQISEWVAYLCAGSAAIGSLVLMRTRRKRLMAHTEQTAAMFMEASSPETRAANESILTNLAQQGLVVPGFTQQIAARLPRTTHEPHAQTVLRLLDEAGETVSFAMLRERTGISHVSLRLALRDLVQRGLISRDGESYQCTRSGQRVLAPLADE